MKKRYLARDVAMKILYADATGGAETPTDVMEQSELGAALSEKDSAFLERIVTGVRAHMEEIDGVIAAHAKGWQLSRIARVELSILRIAVYELRYEKDIPVGATINEAVELAHTFGEEKSPQFINGILGAVAAEAEEA